MFQVLQPTLADKHARQYKATVNKSPVNAALESKKKNSVGQSASCLRGPNLATALDKMASGKPVTKMNP